MSFIGSHEQFAPSRVVEIDFSPVMTLSDDEIDAVNGGIIPFVVATALRCAASTACRVGVLAVAGTVAAAVGYENNRE